MGTNCCPLTSVWEAAGYPWSVRLKALLPAWMPWIRKRFKLSPEISAHIEQENYESRQGTPVRCGGRKGCGKDGQKAPLEIKNRFPLSHSRNSNKRSPATNQMARHGKLGLHSPNGLTRPEESSKDRTPVPPSRGRRLTANFWQRSMPGCGPPQKPGRKRCSAAWSCTSSANRARGWPAG